MTKEFQEDQWPKDSQDADARREQLLLDIEGYEGPIDVLLTLARDQKVDLAKISILELTEQYLAFIDRARQIKLELAADYLVMAAWLTYLKSKLLLPDEKSEEAELSGEAMADALAFQLKRLEKIREVAESLFSRPQLGQHIFYRGMSEGLSATTDTTYEAKLYDIIKAYGDINHRKEYSEYSLKTFALMSAEEAYDRLSAMLGKLPKKDAGTVWATLDQFMPEDLTDALLARSSKASLFTASLELAKQGGAELRQDGAFKPIYIRGRHDRKDDT